MPNQLAGFPPYQKAIAKGHLCSCGAGYPSLDRPIIAVVNSWNEIVAGHAHLRELAQDVKRGILEAGGYPLEFNTIAICDGITQSHSGMKYVLPSRELIADSIEAMIAAHGIFDGMVLLGSCDKIVPAMLMAAARLNIPTAMITGGPMVNQIKPYQSKAARQQFIRGEIREEQLVEVTKAYYPEPGICPFLGTANTMCIVAEVLGLALPRSGTAPSLSQERKDLAYNTGKTILNLLDKGIKPRDLFSREAFENAITVVLAMGASPNTVLHIPAIAAECGIEIGLQDFDRISRSTPLITRIYPNSDTYTVADLHPAGGIPAVLKTLAPLLHKDTLSIDGRTLAAIIADAPEPDGAVIHTLADPFLADSGLAVLFGSLAPEGAVVKTSAVPQNQHVFAGPAHVFESEEECIAAAHSHAIASGEVVIIRNEGPVGGPGMREMHRATELLAGIGNIGIVTDGRFSGASGGLDIGYLSPEACLGGPISLVANGDRIVIDIPARRIDWEVTADTIQERLAVKWEQKQQETASNFLKMYRATTLSAAHGALRRQF